ncbi:somatostatin receptor type 5-like [Liolophura sinensis]|uniref:somatostatin receptor type 5-like n=1 Tax=Liolophura sinensis TaxID=3198878 RepID=UPI0031590792
MDSYYEFDIWEASMGTRIALVSVCGVMTAVGILGNLLIIFLVAKVKSLRTTVNKSLAFLSLADVLFLVYQPVVTMNWEFGVDDSNLGEHLCYFILFYDKGGVFCSTLIFLFVSLDRYIAVCHPLVSLYYWSGRRTFYVLTSIVLLTVAFSFPTYIMSRYDTFPEGNQTLTFCYIYIAEPWMKSYVAGLEVISNFGSVPILVFVYARMVRAILKKKPTEEVARADHAQSARRSPRTRTVIMLLIAVVVFIICRFPRCMLELFNVLSPDIYRFEEALVKRESYIVYWISWICLFANSQANPFIIFIMSSTFRKAFADVFCGCRRKAAKRSGKETTPNTVSSKVSSQAQASTSSQELHATP